MFSEGNRGDLAPAASIRLPARAKIMLVCPITPKRARDIKKAGKRIEFFQGDPEQGLPPPVIPDPRADCLRRQGYPADGEPLACVHAALPLPVDRSSDCASELAGSRA